MKITKSVLIRMLNGQLRDIERYGTELQVIQFISNIRWQYNKEYPFFWAKKYYIDRYAAEKGVERIIKAASNPKQKVEDLKEASKG